MKNKVKILLAFFVFCGLVYAASQTKFYGDILMQSHKITGLTMDLNDTTSASTKDYVDTQMHTRLNKQGGSLFGTLDMQTNYIVRVHGPRSGSVGNLDAVNKYYVNNTFLPLSGGDLTGRLNMKDNPIINLGTPTDATQAATKGYVDSAIFDSQYQYFALRKGSGYTPLYNLDVATNRYFDVVVLKSFSGSITSYFEDGAANCSTFIATKTWKAGDAIKVPFHAYDTFSNTNGTLIVKGSEGAFGNFGITFKRTSSPSFRVFAGTRNYAPNTSALIVSDISGGEFEVGITNITAVSASDVQVILPKCEHYLDDTTYTTELVYDGGNTFAPATISIPSIPAHGCAWISVRMTGYDDTTLGMKWGFEFAVDGTIFRFGQFFVNPANE